MAPVEDGSARFLELFEAIRYRTDLTLILSFLVVQKFLPYLFNYVQCFGTNLAGCKVFPRGGDEDYFALHSDFTANCIFPRVSLLLFQSVYNGFFFSYFRWMQISFPYSATDQLVCRSYNVQNILNIQTLCK